MPKFEYAIVDSPMASAEAYWAEENILDCEDNIQSIVSEYGRIMENGKEEEDINILSSFRSPEGVWTAFVTYDSMKSHDFWYVLVASPINEEDLED